MPNDRSFVEQNRLSTERIRAMAARLSDAEMQRPVGEHWTVAIVFAHLAFWDRRVMFALDRSEQEGRVFDPEVPISVNDLSLPLWAAIPPQAAAQLAIEAAAALDRRLAEFPAELLEQVYAYNARWVERARHRNEHLDEAEAALNS